MHYHTVHIKHDLTLSTNITVFSIVALICEDKNIYEISFNEMIIQYSWFMIDTDIYNDQYLWIRNICIREYGSTLYVGMARK